jgi:hypothetical protein
VNLVWLFLGGLLELFNSLTRWWTVARLQPTMDIDALWITLGGMSLRLLLVAALLVSALKQGILPGLLALAGLWLVRSAAVVWIQFSGSSHWSVPADASSHRPTDIENE